MRLTFGQDLGACAAEHAARLEGEGAEFVLISSTLSQLQSPTVLTVPTTWSLKIIHNKTLNSLTSKKLKATSATSSRGLTTRRSLTTSPSIWRAHLSPHVSVYSKSRTGLPTLPGPSGKREENAESREINAARVPYPKCVQSNVSDRKEVFPPLNI